MAGSVAATARAQPPTRSYAIAGQDLGGALRAFALTSGRDVVFDAASVRGKRTSGVNGELADEDALRLLLAGSGLSFERTGSGGFAIRRAPDQLLSDSPEPRPTARLSRPPPADQRTSESTVSEIIVTAERRAENIQQATVSVTAISGEKLEKLGARSFFDYATLVPNLAFQTGAGAGGNGTGFGVTSSRGIAIRGVFGNNTTSFYINDTPVPMSLDPRILDIAQIEILRGPQGTLFGASAMGGTVKITTREPSTGGFEGSIDALGYDMNHGGGGYSISGSVNVPLAEGLAVRASAFYQYQPGFFTVVFGPATYPPYPGVAVPPGSPEGVRKRVGNNPEVGGSITLKYQPRGLPQLTVEPMLMIQNSTSNGFPLADYYPGNLVQLRPLNVPERTADQWELAALTLRYHARFGDFISSSSFFDRRAFDDEDGTEWVATAGVPSITGAVLPEFVPSASPSILRTKTWTEELRFQSSWDFPIQLIAGVFLQDQKRLYYQLQFSPGANALTGGKLGTDLAFTETTPNEDKQIAGFADLTWKVNTHIELSAGLREAHLIHTFTYTANGWANGGFSTNSGYHSEDDPAPRFSAKYSFDAGNMIYATAAKGFRIGGENAAAPFCGIGETPFTTDSLWSYEVGAKNTWFAGRVQSRLAVYQIDWSNIQQTVVLPCTFAIVENAGGAKSDGAEIELDMRPIPQLAVTAGAGYENARITNTVPGSAFVVGQPISGVPKWTAAASFDYTEPTSWGAAFLRGDISYTGQSRSFNNANRLRDAYTNVDLDAGAQFGRYEVSVFVKNLTDVRANLGDEEPEVGELPGRPRWLISLPREVGLELKARFQ
ncbi:MAG TPA: TonB-dependent receptor [Caulobacteraceae bacterium]|nr:TonB-dependent receptor [Caulobacteraceae bacterium]